MITLLKYNNYYSESRNYVNPAMENLLRICQIEKDNSFLIYKVPLKTELMRNFTNKFGVKALVQIDFSKIRSGKIFILNPSLLEKDLSGMNRLFQHCQDHDIDIFTYVCDSDRFYHILDNIKDYNYQLFNDNIDGVKQYVKRDMVIRDLVS